MLHSLLINNNYDPLRFITERDCFRLLALEKVEPLELWDQVIRHGDDGTIQHPSVIRLVYLVRWIPKTIRFTRLQLLRRDQFVCQYCGKGMIKSELTVDHIIPTSLGGLNGWMNCVAACIKCNNSKSNRTPEQAGMKLLNQPFIPQRNLTNEMKTISIQHESWQDYL